jgi:hypothetical protein
MTVKNSYATLADYKGYVTSRGQTTSTDTADDAVIELLLDAASRYIDDETGRQFYPTIQARYYDAPPERLLMLDEDLLEALSVVTGNSETIPSTDYALQPRNIYPAYGIRITDISSYAWTANVNGSFEDAVIVNGVWGYRQKYNSEAWRVGGILGAAMSTTTGLSATMAAGHTLATGQIWRVGNEILQGSVSSNTLTLTERGANGSTAATHDNGTTVYYWQPERGSTNAVLEIAHNAYNRRFGTSITSNITVTGAGVVITPRDIAAQAQAFIHTHRDRT